MTAQTVVMNHVLDSLARLMCRADRRYCVTLSVRSERNQKRKELGWEGECGKNWRRGSFGRGGSVRGGRRGRYNEGAGQGLGDGGLVNREESGGRRLGGLLHTTPEREGGEYSPSWSRGRGRPLTQLIRPTHAAS
jgi:hypothetical protein